jgi:hypothetical protein
VAIDPQQNPGFSISYMVLAAAPAKLGRSHETKAAEGRGTFSPTSGAADNVPQWAPYQRSPQLSIPKILILIDSQREAKSSRHQVRCLRFGAAEFKSRRDRAPAREDSE